MAGQKKQNFCEADLYKPVSEYLTNLGYTVRGEVGYCDVAAVRDDELLIVELKKNLNLEVVMQAAVRQRLTDNVFIAVPKPGKNLYSKRWKNIYYLLKRLSLGLMFVSIREDISWVEVAFEPAAFDMKASRRKSSKKKADLMKEFESRHGDYNKGGVSRTKILTAYREMAIHIACCLVNRGPLSPKELRLMGTDEKKTTVILRENVYGWFEKLGRGLYGISEKGKLEAADYKELYEYYMNMGKQC